MKRRTIEEIEMENLREDLTRAIAYRYQFSLQEILESYNSTLDRVARVRSDREEGGRREDG